MRLESCVHFDTELFIKNLKTWKEEKRRLQLELESMPELPSVENKSGVRSTDVSDPTSRQAIRRIEIENEIEDIEKCERVYEIARKHLTPEELAVFKVFFEPKDPIWKEIDRFTRGNYTCRMNMYRDRRKILEKLDALIAKEGESW